MNNVLRKTKIYFKPPEEKVSYNVSSTLQGALMDNVSYEFGEKIHQSGLKPYSQYLNYENDVPVWNINTMDDECHHELVDSLLSDKCNDIYLRQKKLTLDIEKKEYQELLYDELLQETFFNTCSRYITIRFKTPTAFKTNDRYQFYPTLELILKSLVNKYNACGFESKIDFEDDINQALEYLEVVNYSLHSTRFYLERTKIPSFMGKITIRIRGPQQLVNLMHMLFRFGEYSGVGIKTAIGMGAIEIERRKESNGHE